MLPSEQNRLVEKHRAGDRHAANELARSFRSYFGYMAKCYGDQREFDGQEAFGVASEEFTKALDKWDPAAGFKYFAHYAKQMIRWKVSTARNKVIHRQQVAYTTPASHSELLDTDPYDRSAQAEARDVLNKLDVLPDERLRTITSMKARGLSNVAVGKELGLSNQYVSTMLNNLWEELNHARV